MMSKIPAFIAAMAFSISLAGCAAAPDKSAPATSPETVEVSPTSTPPAPSAAPVAAVTAVIQVAPPQPKITSRQLLGQLGPWVKRKMGEPQFVRTEKTANIWQYKNGTCVLNVFLYAENDTDTQPRVLHFDARNTNGSNTNRDRCLSTLQN